MFPKKPQPAPSPSRSTTDAMTNASFSVLATGTRITGDIAADTDLHIDGRIEGDIDCAALVQGEASEIRGTIKARTARVAGLVEGSIGAGELIILKSARITGDVSYDTLTIEQGARVEGKLTPRQAADAPRLVVAN